MAEKSLERSVEKEKTLSNLFCQINSLVNHSVNPLLSRNFCKKYVRENSCNFHTTLWKNKKIGLTEKILHQINSLVTNFRKTSRNFCQKCVRHSVEITEIYPHFKIFS